MLKILNIQRAVSKGRKLVYNCNRGSMDKVISIPQLNNSIYLT